MVYVARWEHMEVLKMWCQSGLHVIILYSTLLLPYTHTSPLAIMSEALPHNPQDDNASVQAALSKLNTLRKLSMSGTGQFTPIHHPHTGPSSQANSVVQSRAASRPGSPGEGSHSSMPPPPAALSSITKIESREGGPDDQPVGEMYEGGDGGATGFGGPGAMTPSEARALSTPGTPHFGAQTDMLKTLDESTRVIRDAQATKMSGAQTPSVSGIGTLLEKPDYSEAKIVVAMVGLPARGKSYLSNRLLRYLRWLEYKVQVFNVGQLRRRKARDSAQAGGEPEDHSHNYFSHTNPQGTALREKLASESLESLITWLKKDGGNVGIHDATNSTQARRAKIQERIDREPGFSCIFLESWCDDPDIIASNVALKARSGDPDYKNMSKEEAERDFRKRIEQYESVYETITEPNLSWCKILNVGRQVQINRIDGYLQSRIAFYLMNLHLKPRHIYLSRHGESMHNVGGMIGGDSPLSPRGEQYAAALPALVLNNVGDHPLQVWTSTLQRTIATARNLPYPKKTWKSLDELDAGVCDGMTYEEIAEKYPEDYAARDENKFSYRYRGGESYQDVVVRLEPVIMELERQENIIIICHQAIIRCLYGYFMGLSQEELPYIKVPLHTLIKLTPMAYGCEEERFPVPIPAVDTHRPKPSKSTMDEVPPGASAEQETSTGGDGPARDYFGDSAVPAPSSASATPVPSSLSAAATPGRPLKTPMVDDNHDLPTLKEASTVKMSSEKARNNILLRAAKTADQKAQQQQLTMLSSDWEEGEKEAASNQSSISQADIAKALAASSSHGAKARQDLIAYYDLPIDKSDKTSDRGAMEDARADLVAAPINPSSTMKYNKHKMYCPRQGCGSLILSKGSANWEVRQGGMVSIIFFPFCFPLTLVQGC